MYIYIFFHINILTYIFLICITWIEIGPGEQLDCWWLLVVWAVGLGAQLPKCPSKPTPGAMYHSGFNSFGFSTEIRKYFTSDTRKYFISDFRLQKKYFDSKNISLKPSTK